VPRRGGSPTKEGRAGMDFFTAQGRRWTTQPAVDATA
jgi:hypothetical protein